MYSLLKALYSVQITAQKSRKNGKKNAACTASAAVHAVHAGHAVGRKNMYTAYFITVFGI